MNPYIISGIILIAIGTFLAIFGSINQGKKTASENFPTYQEQYDSLAQKIDSVQQKRADHISKKQIKKIQEEFKDWISKGALEEDNKRHELQSRIVETELKKIELTHEWKHIYEYFYRALEVTLDGYNYEDISVITYEIPALPENLFSIDGSNYTAKVTFPTGKVWHIRHNISDSAPSSLPKIIFQFGNQGESPLRLKLWITIIPNIDQNRMKIKKAGPMISILENIPEQFSLRNYRYESVFRELIRTLIEYELVRTQ